LESWGGNGSASYDVAGNTTNLVSNDGRGLDLQWDERYRLTSVEGRDGSPQPSVSYSYDVLGRKVSRTAGVSPAEVEYYVYNGHQIVADLDGNGDITRSYTWGPGIDNLMSLTVYSNTPTLQNSQTYYPLKDHLNSVLALADENGNIVESYEYDAWGNVFSIKDGSGNVLSQSAIGNRYLFQGREYDFQTGLYYFRARWYSPETGRWLSKDPIGISGGLNLYAFCENNSVNFVDPMGLVSGWKAAVVSAVAEIAASFCGSPVNPPPPTLPPVMEIKSTAEISDKIKSIAKGTVTKAGVILVALLIPATSDAAEIKTNPLDFPIPNSPRVPQPGDPNFIGPIKPSNKK